MKAAPPPPPPLGYQAVRPAKSEIDGLTANAPHDSGKLGRGG